MRRFCLKNNQQGATMIEALGVITIVILLTVSVIKIIGNVYGVFKQNLIVNELKDLQKAISERYRFEGNYKELFENRNTTDDVSRFLCENKMAPYKMCSNGILHHSMAGNVFMEPDDADYQRYKITFDTLTDRACANIAQINWHMQKKPAVYRILIKDSAGARKLDVELPHNQTANSINFPITADTAMQACQNKDNTMIEWTFF